MNNTGGHALVVQEVNTTLIEDTLQQHMIATKHELARLTGLSLMTVSSILQQLEETGEVLQGNLIPSAGGRPSRQYRYNPEASSVITVYTAAKDSGASAAVCVADAFDEIVYTAEQSFDQIGPESFIPLIDTALQKHPAARALGFGIPGVVQDGTIAACDFPQLAGCGLAAIYGSRYGLPIVLDNDVNCVVAGRCSDMELAPGNAVIALYFPKVCALGAGIWIGNDVYRGFRCYAGEAAGIPLDIDWHGDTYLYQDDGAFASAAAKLISTLCCVLDPQEIVLYGSFLTETHLDLIYERLRTGEFFPAPRRAHLPDIVLSPDFERDYRRGLLHLTRGLLKPAFELKRN